jgi:hypothetical protein
MQTLDEFKTFVNNVVFLAVIGVRCNNLMRCDTPVNEYDVNRLANRYRTESQSSFWVRRK